MLCLISEFNFPDFCALNGVIEVNLQSVPTWHVLSVLLLLLSWPQVLPHSVTHSLHPYSFSPLSDWHRVGCQRTHVQKHWRPNGSHGRDGGHAEVE